MCNQGKIFNIQRFSTSDGPGIRTVVFLKGCPIDCVWCHNPESKPMETEIVFRQDMCIGCGACSRSCPKGCHSFEDGLHRFDRDGCTGCGQCVSLCPGNALERCGEERSAREVMDTVLRDRPFYEESGGGMTLSGGEPLMQYDFSLSLLKLAKSHGIHTAVETSGHSGRDLAPMKELVDLWLYDVKLLPEEEHRKHTGASNRIILENLRTLDRMGAKIILRCPVIPGINLTGEHFDGIAALANSLTGVRAIHLEPYHPLGRSKAVRLGRTQVYENDTFLEPSALEPYADSLRAKTDIPVVIL